MDQGISILTEEEPEYKRAVDEFDRVNSNLLVGSSTLAERHSMMTGKLIALARTRAASGSARFLFVSTPACAHSAKVKTG